jgi:hypothetical protein
MSLREVLGSLGRSMSQRHPRVFAPIHLLEGEAVLRESVGGRGEVLETCACSRESPSRCGAGGEANEERSPRLLSRFAPPWSRIARGRLSKSFWMW